MLEWLGVAVFALTGALVAARKEMDPFGFALLATVTGVGEDYLSVRAWQLASGENFTDVDVRNANKVCLIGKTTATTLFGEGDPVGEIIRIKSAPFTVVGRMRTKLGLSEAIHGRSGRSSAANRSSIPLISSA